MCVSMCVSSLLAKILIFFLENPPVNGGFDGNIIPKWIYKWRIFQPAMMTRDGKIGRKYDHQQ